MTGVSFNSFQRQREFTLLLLPIVERKLRRTIPALLSHPPILAHTIYQALAFDTTLRDEGFDLPGTTASPANGKETRHWEGISEVILGKTEWFEAWVEGERKCEFHCLLRAGSMLTVCASIVAMDQYFEIISSSDAWLIADDDGEEESDTRPAVRELRPTNSARRVKALVEQVTGA